MRILAKSLENCIAHFIHYLCLVAQSCLTLCDPTDCSPAGSSAHGILQARILEWVAISFSNSLFGYCHTWIWLPSWLRGKESTCTAADAGSVPGLGRFSGEGSVNWLQYSCLGNPIDRGAWWSIVHGSQRVGHDLVTKTAKFLNIGKCYYYIQRTCFKNFKYDDVLGVLQDNLGD